MITIYHLSHSRSERVIWLMEELGLEYQLETIQRESTGFSRVAPAAYKKLHPIGKSPIIRDGEQVIVESGAIVEYIVNRYGDGRLVPPMDSVEYISYLQWLHFAEGGAMHQFVQQYTLSRVLPETERSPMLDWLAEGARQHADYIETELGTRSYIAGSTFTAADILMPLTISFMMLVMKAGPSDFPNSRAYLERIGQRPAYRKAMAIANP